MNAVAQAQKWLDKMNVALASGSSEKISALFKSDGWWRDHLNLSFDFNSLTTNDIPSYLEKFGVPEITDLKVVDPHDAEINENWLQAFISYETPTARGTGFIRLQESAPGKGDFLAFTFYTALDAIKGHEEFSYSRRPLGTLHGENTGGQRLNWLDKRKTKVQFEDSDPTVLIIGGGQNGLMLAARLGALGIDTLIVEKNERIGDSWRLRYHTLTLHDPIFADHFPYLQYPPHFPIFLPKDKLANWMESYAMAMELNCWTSSTVEPNPEYIDGKWHINVVKNGGAVRTLRVGHIVVATGFSGEPQIPTFPKEEFQGTVVHSSRHKGAQGWEGKHAVVVGCCNSGSDIAADFYESGVNITMVQRSSTYVMSSEHGLKGLLKGFYEEEGPTTAHADAMLLSLPVNLLNQYHIEATKDIAVKDKVMLDGLTAAGYKLNPYPGGLFIKYFRDGGGYYIDVGLCGLIIDKKVKIVQGKEVAKLGPNSVVYADGTETKADIVVLATGYTSMKDTVRRILSDDIADRMQTVWGEDEQGEIPSAWRNTGVPGIHLQMGNFFQARCYSKYLALQIQMIELGLAKKDTPYPAYKEKHNARFS